MHQTIPEMAHCSRRNWLIRSNHDDTLQFLAGL
jgi:hypothetical protein